MPIRDALRILANEKLVENIPNRGFTVSHYKDDELQDTLFLRSILEREAVKLAAGRLTDDDIESMEDLMERMDGCIRRNSLGRLPRLNSNFISLYTMPPHRASCWNLSGNFGTVSRVTPCWPLANRLWFPKSTMPAS